MNDYDYIIAIDENGSPYISHAGILQAARNAGAGLGRGVRASHKYIMKLGEGRGARYFYTPEEVAAYQRAKAALSGAKSKDVSQKRYDETPLGKAENAANKAREKVSEAGSNLKSKSDRMREEFRKKADEAGNAANKVKEKAKDKLGVDEREVAQKAWEKVPKSVKSDDKDAINKLKEATKAQDEYRKTPLGKAEYAKELAEEKTSDIKNDIKDGIKDLTKGAKDTVDKAKQKAQDAKDIVAIEKMIKENAKNQGVSEEQAKQAIYNWAKNYYETSATDVDAEHYLGLIEKAPAKKKK